VAKAAADSGRPAPVPVHLKVDTGMHRVGCHPEHATDLAELVASRAELRLQGVCTHFAVADEPASMYTTGQVTQFEAIRAELAGRGIQPELVHAANSAGLLTQPTARYDLVRVGIALYGVAPAPELDGRVPLHPAMRLESKVAHVKELPAGARISYGLRYELPRAARIATVPAGYADGVPRNLAAVGGEVLVGGHRRPIAGTVTMDQLMVDVGDADVVPGDEVVLLGRQGNAEITAQEWAVRLGTIAYEIVCGIGSRVPRAYGTDAA
jgi:alanine racemase